MCTSSRTFYFYLRPWLRPCLSIFLTSLTLFVTLPVKAQLTCSKVFEASAHATQNLNDIPLIQMNPKYRGEDQGNYIDPVTQTRWHVKYFSETELTPLRVQLKDGLFLDLNGKKLESPFDYKESEYQSSLLVINKEGKILLLNLEERGRYHHSSLSRGEDILFAGTAIFTNGYLRQLTNNSGHYQPTTQQTLKVLRMWQSQGVNFSQAKLSGQAARDLSGQYSISIPELLSHP